MRLPLSSISPDPTVLAYELRTERERNNHSLSFGNPSDGTINLIGAWATATFTANDQTQTFTHNLGVPTNTAGTPNVAWTVMGWRHSGTTAAGTPLSLEFVTGASVTANAIDLTLRSGAARTINGVADQMYVVVWIVPTGVW